MNKLMQNNKIWCHVKVSPIQVDLPDMDMNEGQAFCDKLFNHLKYDKVERLFYRTKRTQHTISIWKDDKYVYLVQVIRTEFKTNEAMIYFAPLTEENISDFKAIAKMIHRDIDKFTEQSIANVHEFNKMAAIAEENKPSGEA